MEVDGEAEGKAEAEAAVELDEWAVESEMGITRLRVPRPAERS